MAGNQGRSGIAGSLNAETDSPSPAQARRHGLRVLAARATLSARAASAGGAQSGVWVRAYALAK
ncbi:hypothetical protein XFF6992_510109 [Xanthomonas citri pv. fuscans]|nr:hypothetical protein XFF6992_510109 [Xanthomonas citri pv. fuscans]